MAQRVGGPILNQVIKIFSVLSVITLLGVVFIIIANDSKSNLAHTLEVESDIIEVFSILKDTERGQRGYLISGDSAYLVPYKNGVTFFKTRLARVKTKTLEDVDQQENIRQLDSLSRLKLEEMNEIINLYNSGQQQKAFNQLNTDVGLGLMNKIEVVINRMVNAERKAMRDNEDTYEYYYYALLFLLAFSIVLTLLLLFTFRRKLKPFLTKLEDANDRLKGLVIEKNKEINLRKKQERINDNLIKQLVNKNRELDHFAYIASHDLQEPFRTVENYITLFKEDYEEELSTGDAPQFFRFIDGAVIRMRNLINGLLQYSRIGRSGELTEVDLNVVINEIREDFDVRIQERKVVLTTGDLPTFKGYFFEIKRLLSNIIANAIKFVDNDVTPHINITAEDGEDDIIIKISDNGIGIDEAFHDKIFNMFNRLHSDSVYPGQGIGLAFCKKIMDLHHGEIYVESTKGKGSTFIMHFPKSTDHEEKTQ